jgi:hypothetical protein
LRFEREAQARGDAIVNEARAKALAIENALVEFDNNRPEFRGWADRVVRKAIGRGIRD